MKSKVVVVDSELPASLKRWLIRVGLFLGMVIGGGALAHAATLVTWTSNQSLTAADLNSNFSAVQTQITTVQGQVTTLQAKVTAQAGALQVFNPAAGVNAPCSVAFGSTVDCTCPTGTFVVSGGADAGQVPAGHFIRESRATSSTSWRVSCSNGTADALCYAYNLVCTRAGS